MSSPAADRLSSCRRRATTVAWSLPFTSRVKGFPFEVGIPDGRDVSGVVLADQITSVDWRARGVTLMDRLPVEFVETIARKFSKLLP